MFNLLMTAGEGNWDGAPYEYGLERVFEYTSDAIRERFTGLDGDTLNELIALPALFAYEKQVEGDARIGWITRVLKRGRKVRIEYAFEPTLPTIPAASFAELVWELDIGEWEMNRTHWAVKDVDLFPILIEAGLVTTDQVNALPMNRQAIPDIPQPVAPVPVQPTVFRIPEGEQEPDLVSVMMPFQPDFRSVYHSIQRVCRDLGIRCLNANEVWNENEIIQEIFSLIYRSKVVVCDFSERNPNVFYEAGIAHTLGRQMIPIVQYADHAPFDLRHHRYIKYLNNDEGLETLRTQIAPRLQTLIRR